MPEGPLAVLRELERADEEIGAELAGLERLAAELDQLRAKAQDLQAFAARLPAERERRRAELDRARGEVREADRVFAEAEESVRTATPDAARDAELFAVRAQDRVSAAERRAAAAGAAATDLEIRAGEVTVESHRLHASARKLAADLRGRPRIAEDAGKEPGTGLDGVAAWGEAVRAALFVARGQLAAERDALIRQANEIGALALGEPLTAMGTGALARRVEQVVSRGDA